MAAPVTDTEARASFTEVALLAAILAIAAAARLWSLNAGVPHAIGVDEARVVDQALRILHTGSWNTHAFDDPTLVVYLQAGADIVRFLWGALSGQWASLEAFSIAAVYAAGRFVTATIGVATVWLTWRLARDLASRPVALLAAAQLAVGSMHVRQSHYVLTDVPMTALTTLALWLAVRAGRLRTVTAYVLAGAACGLAAAASYGGGIVLIAAAVTWLLHERDAEDRGTKAAAIVGAAAVAFLIAAPYTLLDMPAFLDGFAAQFSRLAASAAEDGPVWLTSVKHLSPGWSQWWWLPLAGAGILMVLWREATRALWVPLVVFVTAFFYVVASRSLVLGRSALPLLPPLCVLSAVAAVELTTALRRRALLAGAARHGALSAAVLILLLVPPAIESVKWLDGLKRADTREMAADWLKSNAPQGSRIAVENSGPAYLEAAGLRVVAAASMAEHPADWYRRHADYLVISAADVAPYREYLDAGPTVLQVMPSPQRWGPPIRIVALRRADP